MITLKPESSRHCVIYQDDKWLATVSTERDKGLGEAVKELIEQRAASANTAKESKWTNCKRN